MCGICGFSGQGNQEDLLRMMNAIPYRGPDDNGQWQDNNGNHLGHVRLSIVDISDGQQPLASADGSIIVVFNGEIYNHRELRQELEGKGHVFKTDHSDTEVIIYGYREWGVSITERLNGMWAFCLLDNNSGIMWLSRDRFGKKPLYYAEVGQNFVFSSELSSISEHSVIHPRIDRLSLKKYFAHGYIPAPRSMLTGVNKLEAGHNLIYDLRKRVSKVQRYWRLRLEPDDALSTVEIESEVSRTLIEKLSAAVDTRMEADVPVGIFMSGGIDSSAIAALAVAAKHGESVRTFSIGFEEPSFDESIYSDKVAQHLNTKHTREVLSLSRSIELLDSIYSRLDEPLADSSLIPTFLICQLAKNDVTVVLGGDGSDELFAGYDPFKALGYSRIYNRLIPGKLHNLIEGVANKFPVSHKNMSLDFKLKKFISGSGFKPYYRNPVWLGPLSPQSIAELFREETDEEELYSEAIDAWYAVDRDNDVDRTLQFYTELYLQNDILTKVDRAGMLNSLEVRCPFLDVEFVDYVRTIPSHMKYDGRTTKKVLKKSLHHWLPKEILYREKKGFGVPIGKWFKNEQLTIGNENFDGILDVKVVDKMLKQHVNNQADWRSFLWAYYVMERWSNRPMFCN